jgi:glycogen debranching enzyme
MSSYNGNGKQPVPPSEEHGTGMGVHDPVLVGDGAFIHFLPDGRLGKYGLITRDTQHISQWDWNFLPDEETARHAKGAQQRDYEDTICTKIDQKDYNTLEFHYRNERKGIEIIRRVELQDSRNTHETITIRNITDHSITVKEPFSVRVGAEFRGLFEIRDAGKSGYVPYVREIRHNENGFESNRIDRETPSPGKDWNTSGEKKTIYTSFWPQVPYSHEKNIPITSAFEDGGHTLVHTFNVNAELKRGETVSFSQWIKTEHGCQELDMSLPSLEAWREEFGIPKELLTEEREKFPKEWQPLVTAVDQLHAMMIMSPEGIVFAAGLPNFMCPFGRDMLETAQKIMPDNSLPYPQHWRAMALKGILSFLAVNQGKKDRWYKTPGKDAYPHPILIESFGAIGHEFRSDEASGMGLQSLEEQKAYDAIQSDNKLFRTPFARCYTHADEPLLFVAVAGEYLKATGDLDHRIPQAMENVMTWVENCRLNGLMDENGFLYYEAILSQGEKGAPVTQKAWKDSFNSMVLPDGSTFLQRAQRDKIAPIEVQGYLYSAYKAMAELNRQKKTQEGDRNAADYEDKARILQESVLKHYLTQDKDGNPVYAMALGYHADNTEIAALLPKILEYLELKPRNNAKTIQDVKDLLGFFHYREQYRLTSCPSIHGPDWETKANLRALEHMMKSEKALRTIRIAPNNMLSKEAKEAKQAIARIKEIIPAYEKIVKMNVQSSNPAHAMWTGIFDVKEEIGVREENNNKEENIVPILDALEDENRLWSGWGFRTLGIKEGAYNCDPKTAYHNGPPWPYESGLICEGLFPYAKSGGRALNIIDTASRSLYELALISPGQTVPELISGAQREGSTKPPENLETSCRIQTWSSAALAETLEIRRKLKLPDLIKEYGEQLQGVYQAIPSALLHRVQPLQPLAHSNSPSPGITY